MKIKTYRFAAVAAVLLALLVFMAPVGAEAVTVDNDDEFKTAVTYNAVDIVVTLDADVSYDVGPWGQNALGGKDTKTITINGNYHTLTFNQLDSDWNNVHTNGATLILNNVKITNGGHNDGPWNRHDINFNCSVELTNVYSDKALAFKKGATLTNVTINDPNTSDTYAIWIQPNGQTVTINGLTIDMIGCSDGRGIKIDEQYVDNPVKVTLSITDATFKTEEKSAIIVKSKAGADITLNGNIDISNVAGDNDFAVWIDEDSAAYANLVTVTGGSVKVEGVDPVAKIDNVYYGTLADAITAVPTDGTKTTITLLKSTEGAGIKTADRQNVVIDFGGFTYTINGLVGSTGTESNGFQLLKGSDVELKNGKIAVSEDVSEAAGILIQNYANLTLSDITLDGTNLENEHSEAYPYCYTLSNNCGIVSIGDGTVIIAKDGYVAFDVCYSESYYKTGTQVTVESGATINGNIEFGIWTGDSVSNPASSLRINGGTINGNLVVDGELTEAAKSLIVIYGGTFSSNPSAYIASGYEVVQPGNQYLVQKYVDRSSSSSSSSKPVEEPEEPEQPEQPVVEPETPAAPGEATVETEVTDGGEVEFEAPVEEPGVDGGSAAADEDEAKITGVVLPTGTDSEVAFVPVSEQPAPAGQEENTKKVFEINVPTYEKGKPATIKFTMTVAELEADGKEAADVALWHFDEETGEWTKLVTSYTIVDGVVYFEAITNDFSPFAIIYEDEPVDEPVEEPETPASPAPVLGLLAALGAAVVLRRK